MPLSSTQLDTLNALKKEIRKHSSSDLEHLAAALLGRLLDVPITVAKSGFQHGADAGSAGEQGRRLRVECKKYDDSSDLSERELLGEIDQALARDEALEVWVLIATRDVPEQTRQSLVQKGERVGVPVPIIDWPVVDEVAPLAALCTFAPDLVERRISEDAGMAASTLQPISGEAIETLRRNLESWSLGFESIRAQSHKHLQRIWTSPRDSNAKFGQNASGGYETRRVRREGVNKALCAWWQGPASGDALGAVVGLEGVGKTWAALDWLVDRKEEHPIILIISSSMAAAMTTVSETGVKRFLADRVHEITNTRDSEHWLRRLDNLLKRPIEEGPVVTVFFDGLNQEPSVEWLLLFKLLQGGAFAGRIRAIVTTRTHYFEDRLRKLRSLVVPSVGIDVGDYDSSELDRMLEFEGLNQNDLHSDVIELARNPRLFKLVVRFREKLAEPGQATLHRLLWEYGRDTFGVFPEKSFSETEWKGWLSIIAQQYREGMREFSTRSLANTVDRPDLTERHVYARLSDIVDGRFSEQDQSGNWNLSPVLVAHALGVALLNHLGQVDSTNFDTLNGRLAKWLDPISGFDEPAEILRAAVSVLVGQGRAEPSPIAGVLVTALLQTQNVTDHHRQELAHLASSLPTALLDTIEHSDSPSQSSALRWAVKALHNIPKTNSAVFTAIIERARRWLSIVSRDVNPRPNADIETEKWRSQRLVSRIGVDYSGPLTVTGIEIELVDNIESSRQTAIPAIMDGFPLAAAGPVFEVAAVAFAIRGRSEMWDGLRWLCLFNETDLDATTTCLRSLSERFRNMVPERGVHQHLPKRIAALLLWLTGQEEDDQTAATIDPSLEHPASYEEDYLPQPGHSMWFPLERRHVNLVLRDPELSPIARAERVNELWLDPDFEPQDSFVSEIRKTASGIEVEELHRHTDKAAEIHQFELLEPVLARCAPELLANLVRRKMRSIGTSPPESRQWNAHHATDHLVLAGKAESAAARTLRRSSSEDDEANERYASSRLLLLEIGDLETQDQFDTLIDAGVNNLFMNVTEILRRPTRAEVDALIERHGSGPSGRQLDLLKLFSLFPVELTENAWSWVEHFANLNKTDDGRKYGFRVLAGADPVRFGRSLEAEGWSWRPDEDIEINHHGTHALINATSKIPFEELVARLAPWRLLEATRLRGATSPEVELAAAILDEMLASDGLEAPDPGSILSVDTTKTWPWPLTFLARPRPSGDDLENLQRAFDPKRRTQLYRRAGDTALFRVREAWKSGASLYLMPMNAMDFVPVFQYVPEMVQKWLEGMNGPTTDFERRIRLAEGAFIAICEGLLVHNPEVGTQLWRILQDTVTTQYFGLAEVDELVHMVFRAPDSSAVAKLRRELANWKYSNTDQDLFDLAIAASSNGRADWLVSLVEEDRKSKFAWRRRRAEMLAGFASYNELPIPKAWPDGEIRKDHAALISNSARSSWLEACCRHWWRAFLDARNPVDAYAAWILFLRSADRRAWVWMRREVEDLDVSDEFHKLKMAHGQLNQSRLKETATRRYNQFDRKYLRRNIFEGISPWHE